MRSTQIRLYINPDIHTRFIARFGNKGAVGYVLEHAMEELLDMTEGDPSLADRARQAIRLHILRDTATTPRPRSQDAHETSAD